MGSGGIAPVIFRHRN